MTSELICVRCGCTMVILSVDVDDKQWVCSNKKCPWFAPVPQ